MTLSMFKTGLCRLGITLCLITATLGVALAEDRPPLYEPTTLKEQVDRAEDTERDEVISLVIENDMFGKGTDQNYTSGVSLSYLNLEAGIPDFARTVDHLIPTFVLNDTSSVYFTAGHNIYTPDDITMAEQNPDDRPWAAFLYGSMGLVTLSDMHVDNVELTLGVVGPMAFGEEIQSFVHENISDSPEPEGWDNQLDNEPGLMVAWQRRWPEFFMHNFDDMTFAVEPNIGVTLGNIYTYANTGLNFRFGPAAERWQDTPVRVRPAIPGTGYFEIPDDSPWSWFLFGGIEGRAIARNIFLDGNTFSDSHSVDKRYFVADINAGLAVTYDQFRVSYTLNYRTSEYEQQGENDLFGAISLGYRF